MAKNLNTLVFVLLTVATLLHGSLAQTKHVVGDSTGWTIATGGAQFYSNWASKQTFTVGDTLGKKENNRFLHVTYSVFSLNRVNSF
jgi:hypothetical protein